MSQKELAEIAAALASEYPGGDKAGTAQEFQSVVETVLPPLAYRASLTIGRGVEDVTETWQLIREGSEGLFEEALKKADRVKVIFVASKFTNNKLIGEMVTKQALEIARRGKEN
ncbi:MAG: hypothetical protein AB1603_07235 [Chloroflexota bacterium]